MADTKTLTTNFGAPVPDNQHSLTAGERGPILLQDYFLIEKLAHFDRERIPERVVHAKGAGAFGYFEATARHEQPHPAHLFGAAGRKTPVLVRFSTVGGEKGSADADRDPRGFAIKFYTEEGNYDLVGNNTPVFFIRDPFKFPDMVHTHKRNPQSNLKDHNAFWDFFSHTPESTHMVTILFSDRGTPRTYRNMHGFGSHTFKWVNADGQGGVGEVPLQDRGRHRRTSPPRRRRASPERIPITPRAICSSTSAAAATRRGRRTCRSCRSTTPTTYRYDPFDVTKVWLYQDYPLIPIGRLVLDRNPDNFFARDRAGGVQPGELRSRHRAVARQAAARAAVLVSGHAAPPARRRTTR